MKIKFKTFWPYTEHANNVTATDALNKWLEENPKVDIIDWQTTAVGVPGILYITIQYTEKYPTTSVCSGGCP